MRRWLLPLGALAVVVFGAAWFFATFERVPGKQWVGPSAEARRDPFLAAVRLAERMGVPAHPVRALPELDKLPGDGVLLLPAGRQAIDPRRLRRLVDWAAGGGHLIVEAELPGVSDPLLEALGVQRRAGGRNFKAPPVQTAQGRTLKVSLFGRTVLQLPEDAQVLFSAGSGRATVMASMEHGRGTVSVAGSFAFARNNLIGTDDNAVFFWYLLELAPAKALYVFLRQERLSLWSFLRQHAAPVLAAVAALLVLWLWRIGPRFGPVLPDAPPARRRLLDHLRASGRYYWARGLRARLVIAARDAALRHVAHAHPDFGEASPEERASRLASLISIPPDEARRFMSRAEAASGADFVHLMHTAQKIHSALEKGNR
ncbi:MAG TPA: DUF4350 domain-containing protein [Burkholderiales bacterium]|nr:DUF4350 domain-containing protein [Burkholderiales bacterium]